MRVFLSWSGARSAALARALREWLPNVIQAVEPWMSESDIDRGARWSSEIAAELEKAQIGIMCLTPDNVSSPWLHFEAGALSKALDKSLVCTYLLDLEPTDLQWPLAMFQATRANREETKQLLVTINRALGESVGLPSERLDKAFERWWPELADQIMRAPPSDNAAKSRRSDRELLEEILGLLRSRTGEKQARDSAASEEQVRDAAAALDRAREASTAFRAAEDQVAFLESRARELNTPGEVESSDSRAALEQRQTIEQALQAARSRRETARLAAIAALQEAHINLGNVKLWK